MEISKLLSKLISLLPSNFNNDNISCYENKSSTVNPNYFKISSNYNNKKEKSKDKKKEKKDKKNKTDKKDKKNKTDKKDKKEKLDKTEKTDKKEKLDKKEIKIKNDKKEINIKDKKERNEKIKDNIPDKKIDTEKSSIITNDTKSEDTKSESIYPHKSETTAESITLSENSDTKKNVLNRNLIENKENSDGEQYTNYIKKLIHKLAKLDLNFLKNGKPTDNELIKYERNSTVELTKWSIQQKNKYMLLAKQLYHENERLRCLLAGYERDYTNYQESIPYISYDEGDYSCWNY